MEQKENFCRPPEYTVDMIGDMYKEGIARALRLSTILDILGDGYDLDRLRELVEADRDGQCVILPDVDDKAKKSVAEGLRDFFQEWAYEDRAVGLCGMTEEEKKVAEALLLALNGGRPC